LVFNRYNGFKLLPTIPRKKGMTTNQKEEAMGYQRIGMAQTLLLAGVLLWVFVIAGCGSNESPPATRQKQKPAVSAKPQVREILPESSPEVAIAPQPLLRQPESDGLEVIPPDHPGGPGLTAAEIRAKAAAAPIDPNLTEVIPPDQPGGRGLTAAEVRARIAAASPLEDNLVIPPPPPPPNGARGVTGSK
jgi:hypothetical protein